MISQKVLDQLKITEPELGLFEFIAGPEGLYIGFLPKKQELWVDTKDEKKMLAEVTTIVEDCIGNHYAM